MSIDEEHRELISGEDSPRHYEIEHFYRDHPFKYTPGKISSVGGGKVLSSKEESHIIAHLNRDIPSRDTLRQLAKERARAEGKSITIDYYAGKRLFADRTGRVHLQDKKTGKFIPSASYSG